MTDPELEYARLVSGDAGAIRALAADLDASLHDLVRVREDLIGAGSIPVWFGPAAMVFGLRVSGLRQGLSVTRGVLVQTRGALYAAAGAYERAVDLADHYIAFWRNRPSGLPDAIEEIFARLVNARLIAVGRSYNTQLSGIEAMLAGEDVDLDELDDETRTWVEEGMAKNEEWLDSNSSDLGPLIPNTAATGDDRGLIPQGLGYDPSSHTLVQGYYTKDGGSYLALIDEVTGQEIGEVRLGDTYVDSDGKTVREGSPTHAGGVTVDGDNVYVVDNGEVYTYSLADLQSRSPGETVQQSAPAQKEMRGGSYSAVKNGKLYLGDHEKDRLYVYERGPTGAWVQVDEVITPPNCQGVHVRDDEFVFSASSGRHEDNSQLYVQDFDGNRSDAYDLPSMSQGVVEVDGELIVTYESGAEEFDHAIRGTSGWWWGVDDYSDLWANPHMTRTPLSELGLGEDVEVQPGTLTEAAGEFEALAGGVARVAQDVAGTRVDGHLLGEVPHAHRLSLVVNRALRSSGDSLTTGGRAVVAVAELLRSSARDYTVTDDRVDLTFRRLTPLDGGP